MTGGRNKRSRLNKKYCLKKPLNESKLDQHDPKRLQCELQLGQDVSLTKQLHSDSSPEILDSSKEVSSTTQLKNCESPSDILDYSDTLGDPESYDIKLEREEYTESSDASSPKSTATLPETNRHCAFCLVAVNPTSLQLCNGCNRRAYCSVNCLESDWSLYGPGQQHYSWCSKHQSCEEDIDWYIVNIPNKGVGIRAKKAIKAGSRIIVEKVFTNPYAHSGILDLSPDGIIFLPEHKFSINSLGKNLDRESGKPCVGLRISRVNHSCRPNSANFYDSTAKVEILIALEDIQEGEEISRQYLNFGFLDSSRPSAGMTSQHELYSYRRLLFNKWGISCPKEYYCQQPSIIELVLEGRKLDELIVDLVRKGCIEQALEIGDKLLQIHSFLNLSWVERAGVHSRLFQIGILKRKSFSIACKHIKFAVDIFKICAPFSTSTKQLEINLMYPKKHANYLRLEK